MVPAQAEMNFSQMSSFLELAWAKHFRVCLPLNDPIAIWEAVATQSLMPLPAPVVSFLLLGSRVTYYGTFYSLTAMIHFSVCYFLPTWDVTLSVFASL